MPSLWGSDVPVKLTGSIDINGETARAEFETTLSRALFGIGEATAQYLPEHGANVVLAARSISAIQAIADELRQTGVRATA
ncbi:hypothetical protein [Ruegeria hyattellae]|uniref:hypothetical protein n=1 Tax=Ruegeria hyattellae TaxID=3233337 RepID=UPI00355BA155